MEPPKPKSLDDFPHFIVTGILGWDKTGDDRWYKTAIPMAEAIYQQHLREIRR
jgi:hypothetical protein